MGLKRFSKILKDVARAPKQTYNDMKKADSTEEKRNVLRRHHAKTIHPFQSNTKDIRNAQEKIDSGDPAQMEEGYRLRDRADKRTKDQGAAGLIYLGGTLFNNSRSPDDADTPTISPTSNDTNNYGNVDWNDAFTKGQQVLNDKQRQDGGRQFPQKPGPQYSNITKPQQPGISDYTVSPTRKRVSIWQTFLSLFGLSKEV